MKKYFYTDGINKIGPFSFDELKRKTSQEKQKYGIMDWRDGLLYQK